MLEIVKGTLLTFVLAIIFVGLGVFAFDLEVRAIEFDISTESGMSKEELGEALKHDLKPYARAFLNAEEDYGINALFLASIAAHESGWGRSDLAKDKNNLFGWKGEEGFKEFESAEQCIDYVAWKISKKYINKGLDTLEKIGPVYCDEDWAGYIRDIWGGFLK